MTSFGSRPSLRGLMQAGAGVRKDPHLLQARAQLTQAERRRVGRLVSKGEAAWDAPSASYAVAVARARASIPQPFSQRTTRILYGGMSVVSLIDGVSGLWHANHRVFGAYEIAISVLFAYLAATYPNIHNQARAALRRNEALLEGLPDDPIAPSTPVPASWAEQAIGMLVVVAAFGAIGAFGVWVGGGFKGEPVERYVLVGLGMGFGFLVLMRIFNARGQDRARKRRGLSG